MRSQNRAEIQRAFTQQAEGFESEKMNFSKQSYLHEIVLRIDPQETDEVLEVAAGTCACGRAIAPRAGHVICLDMTPAMLRVGREAAAREGNANLSFVLGDAAELPFLENSFDIVLSRLAFHHFPVAEPPFAEMVRVLKPGGKLVLSDMEAAPEALRDTEDALERLRDPSHVRCLSQAEMRALYARHGLDIRVCEVTRLPVKLQNWMEHTAAPPEVQTEIRTRMQQELEGGAQTGFSPYLREGEVWFDHRWILLCGVKR